MQNKGFRKERPGVGVQAQSKDMKANIHKKYITKADIEVYAACIIGVGIYMYALIGAWIG